MGIDTDLNQAPYFDDFDPEKGYHRVLFKPGLAVQARELTQLQTTLQHQIEIFGNSILREGTIIEGCNFVEVPDLGHVKIRDLETTGAPVSMNSYKDRKAVGSVSGVEAQVVEVAFGFESQAPDLNTLFVKYTKPGNSTTVSGKATNYKTFLPNENIAIYDNTTNELIATLSATTAGKAYGVRVGDGYIYQKGHFVRVEEQLTIMSKYTNVPDDLVVGFRTDESLVNSFVDTSLLDNASGYNNFNAPGADRLKLTAVLTTKTLDEARADERFFAIQEYNNGRVVRRNRTTQYQGIINQIEERTKEESGNYTVNDFPIRLGQHDSNTALLSVNIGAGKAYVEGKRVELLNTFNLDLEKSTTFNTEAEQTIATNYGHYILVNDLKGNFDPHEGSTVNLKDAQQGGNILAPNGTTIGTAKVKAITLEDGVAGANTATYRAYIFDIRMNANANFNSVQSIHFDDPATVLDGVADLVSTTIYESTFKRTIFPIGRSSIKALPATGTNADFIRRTAAKNLVLNANGSMTITLSDTGAEWPYTGTLNNTQKRDIILIPTTSSGSYVQGQVIDLSSATVTVASTTSLTITGLASVGSPLTVVGYYNVKQTFSQPTKKDLLTVYVKIDLDANTATASSWSLGLPDVYAIEKVWVGTGTTYTESDAFDKTSNFALVTNQKDTHYGLSAVQKTNRSYTLTSNNNLLVKAKVFQRNTSGSFGKGFFTINSYPIDDANTANTQAITTQTIPRYTSESGEIIDLRNVVDFRPYASNTAAYATTAAAATVNPSSVVTFGVEDLYVPAPNEDFEASYEYYLGRRDLVILDETGNFAIVKGKPSENPSTPVEPQLGMVLAAVDVPPYPSLTRRDATSIRRPEFAVNVEKRENKRYTMKDIGSLEKRISTMEYYTALNALEIKSKDLVITDANGNDRFKNGIFVDNFEDLSIANVQDSDFSVGVDPAFKEITPKFDSFPLDLRRITSTGFAWSGTKDFGEVATLNPTRERVLIEQPYATRFRNCTTDFHKYNGTAIISPEYDSAVDVERAPVANINVDLSKPFADFTEELSKFVPLQSVDTDVVTNTTSQNVPGGRLVSVEEITTSITTGLSQKNKTTKTRVGDYLTDINFNPYMRSRLVGISVNGLRPNTRHYFYFDGVDVNEYVAPATEDADLDVDVSNTKRLRRLIPFGSPVRTDSNGNLLAVFLIPEGVFFVGDRLLEINDVDDLTSVDASVSSASVMYRAFNFSATKQRINVVTREPSFNTETTSSQSVSTSTTFVRNSTNRNDGFGPRTGIDPIAQTFTVRRDHSTDTVVNIPKIDLYFKAKGNSGVTVQIRETENGYPTSRVVPFGSVKLRANQVNVSDNSTVATTITFPGPVTLKTDTEYCFVVIPDGASPDYLIWTSKVGERDQATNLAVTMDFNDGTLFTSTNDKAWTPYQSENIKFKLYKSQYSTTTGIVNLTNEDHEFLSIETVSGRFRGGEEVGVLTANLTGTAVISANTRTITSTTATAFDTFVVGDRIGYYANSSTVEFLRITQKVSSNNIVVSSPPSYSNTAANFFRTTTGFVTQYNRRKSPIRLVLERSSAKTGQVFAAGQTIIGETSRAIATITSVDDIGISYLQPNIYRTNFSKTNVTMTANVTASGSSTRYSVDMPFNNNTYMTKNEVSVRSRSNEVTNLAGAKSLTLRLQLENTSGTIGDSTPVIDYAISNINVYEYQVNNDLTNENGRFGNALSKYISKTVRLAENLDAEDMKVWLTAYRPAGTGIAVYARFQNVADPRNFDEIPWTRLEAESNPASSAADRFDFRELQFSVPKTSTFLAGGDAALNTNNSEILRYIDDNGIIYDRYRIFAIKIVLLSNSHRIVPRVRDVRAIALT